jgi:hypothetical protein
VSLLSCFASKIHSMWCGRSFQRNPDEELFDFLANRRIANSRGKYSLHTVRQLIPISLVCNCVEIHVGKTKRDKNLARNKLVFYPILTRVRMFFFPSCPGSGFSLLPRTKAVHTFLPRRLLGVSCLPPPPRPLPFQCNKVTRGVNTRERVGSCYI